MQEWWEVRQALARRHDADAPAERFRDVQRDVYEDTAVRRDVEQHSRAWMSVLVREPAASHPPS